MRNSIILHSRLFNWFTMLTVVWTGILSLSGSIQLSSAFTIHNPSLSVASTRITTTNLLQKNTPTSPSSLSIPSQLFALLNDEDEADDEEEGKIERQRKRDRIKDWMYGGVSRSNGGGSDLVRPIRLEDEGKDKSSEDDDDSLSTSRRNVQSKFDNLFSGMPGIKDILGSGDNVDDKTDIDDTMKKSAGSKVEDDSWFEEERQQIIKNYDVIYDEMMETLQKEQSNNNDNNEHFPDNAQAVIKSVLKQEMEKEIKLTKQKRINEQIQKYELEKRLDIDENFDRLVQQQSIESTNKVQDLIQKSQDEYKRQQTNRLELEEFLKYEQDAIYKSTMAAEDDMSNSNIQKPQSNEDLDMWALQRLKEMAEKRSTESYDIDDIYSDGDEMILDILQENVEDLEQRIKKETNKKGGGTVKPETMKEWQMYRSIATRLGDEKQQEEILKRLQSWKDYIIKEDGIRKQSGLSRNIPKLPFDWQESELNERKIKDEDEKVVLSTIQSKVEARKELNKKSIEAMESLLATTDPARRERLQKEIDFLKSTLVSNDYLDVDESFLQDDDSSSSTTTPIDTKDLFRPYSEDVTENKPSINQQTTTITPTSSSSSIQEQKPVEQPPQTPFFQDYYTNYSVDDDDDNSNKKAARPNTPFFNTEEEDDIGETLTGEDSKLGTMEDQKLEAMFRRANARTAEERAKIRAQYEEFKEFERGRRQQSGLSYTDDDDNNSGFDASTTLKYNVSAVMKDDGDFDADAVLATIGPRPTRKPKDPTTTTTTTSTSSTSSYGGVDKREVMDSLYRSVAAVGGGRYKDDPEAKAKQQSSFQEFVEKENKLRESLDDPTANFSSAALTNDEDMPSPLDDEEYAEEVLSSLGSRPKPKRTRVIDPRDYSDKGGVLSSIDDDDDDDGDETDADEESGSTEEIGLMPEWLRKENEEAKGNTIRRKSFLGNDIDEVFDDTDYEHNMRQLAEYERRRSGRTRQMGIDISDVLGRRAYDTDDYADYKYDNEYFRGRQDSWGSESFTARKRNLLEYTELDVLELNALMDHKESVYSTGVSQYLPRINKPFRAFGAIFRLEGVLLDIVGIQMNAWVKVAEKYGYKLPTIEEVKQASVTRPELAIKDIFYWSDDFLECRDIAAYHKEAFRDVFNTWAQEKGITIPSANTMYEPTRGSLAMGEEVVQQNVQQSNFPTPSTEAEKLELISKAWEATANIYKRDSPRQDQLILAASLSPDIAVMRAFGWSNDPLEIDDIVRTYRKNLQSAATGSPAVSEPVTSRPPQVMNSISTSTNGSRPLTQTDVMEMHYRAWATVAESRGYKAPDSDEVLAAFVINEPAVAAQGFGWSTDSNELKKIANEFMEKLDALKNGGASRTAEAAPTPEANGASYEVKKTPSGPTPDQIYSTARDAWSTTAFKLGFPQPDDEQVRFALTVGPEEAVAVGFQWSRDKKKMNEIVETYREEVSKRRSTWQKDAKISPQTFRPPILDRMASTVPQGPSVDEVFRTAFDAWTAVAQKSGFLLPDKEQVMFALSVGPEEAVMTGFGWASTDKDVDDLVAKYREEIGKRRRNWRPPTIETKKSDGDDEIPKFRVSPGAAKWIKSLQDVEMQCGVISYLERQQVDILLEHAGLDQLIEPEKRVSASNGYRTDKDAMLGAALRLERRPDHCVIFDTTPQASVAAHDVEMRSVSIIGPYPRYELLSADTTTASFEELTAMNIRRLFGERIYDQTQVASEQSAPERKQRTKTRYFFDDD